MSAGEERQGTPRLADDLLEGAAAIAGFVYGGPEHVRKIYHLAATSRLPTFRFGGMLCARKSVLMAWITRQEAASSSAQV